MVSQTQVAAAFLALTVVIGAVVYYVVDMSGLDPLGLFADTTPSLAAPEVQEAAIEALVTALDGDLKGKGGNIIFKRKKAKSRKDIDSMYEEMVLGDLVSERLKKQRRAKQHARETVAAVVEEMTHDRDEQTKERERRKQEEVNTENNSQAN